MTREELCAIRRERAIKKPKPQKKRKDYDVMITIQGSRKKAVFRFWNKAREVFADVHRIEPTSVEKMPNRIYFIPCDTKKRGNYQLFRNSGWGFEVSPNETELGVFVKKWVNRKLDIQHDAECDLYYIELSN